MRQFDYTKKWKKMLTPEIVRYLTTIHEYKGEQRLIAEHHADVLESLVEVAKIQSTESSNKIEGIYTSDERLKKIVLDKTMPKTGMCLTQYTRISRTFQSVIHSYYNFIEICINLRMPLMVDNLRLLTI